MKKFLLFCLFPLLLQAEISPVVVDSSHVAIWGIACHELGLYYTEMGGKLYRQTEDTTVLLLHKLVQTTGQVGMLDVVLTERDGGLYALLSMVDIFDRFLVQEYRIEGDVALLQRTLMDIPAYRYKMGGRMAVSDSGVYVSVGIGDLAAAAAQDVSLPYGKVWQIDLVTETARIYAIGFRNVQGLAIDSYGNLYSSGHGNIGGDEINLVLDGENYGYGAADSLITVPPLLDFAKAPSGAVFYEGDYLPDLKNRLVVAQLKGEALMATDLVSSVYPVYFKNDFGRFRDVCSCSDGRVYAATSNHDLYGAGGLDYVVALRPVHSLYAVLEGGMNDSLTVDYLAGAALVGSERVSLADSVVWVHPPFGADKLVVRHYNHLDVVVHAPFANVVHVGLLLAGDADGDGVITVHDFNLFQAGSALADWNGDGVLTVADFNLYLSNLGMIGSVWVR